MKKSIFLVLAVALAVPMSAGAMGDQIMLGDYQSEVDRLARDDACKLDVADRDAAIESAVLRYGADMPDYEIEDVVSAGGQYLDTPSRWDNDVSAVTSLEFPLGNAPPTYINGRWVYCAPGGVVTIGVPVSLHNGDTVRMTYTVPHRLDETNDSIPLKHREAVASYAAALLCDQLSTLYSGDSDSTIQADNVDHGNKAREFSSRANKLRKRYHDMLGVEPKKSVAAGVVVDLDNTDSRGRDRFFHKSRYM